MLISPPVPDCYDAFPLVGPAQLRAFAELHGFQLDLVDLTTRIRHAHRFPHRRRPFPRFPLVLFGDKARVWAHLDGRVDPKIQRLVDGIIELGNLGSYNLVGFCLHSRMGIAAALCISKTLKERFGATIVLGGASIIRGDLDPLMEFSWIDYLVKGDGEEPLIRILRKHAAGEEVELEGVCTRGEGGEIRFAPPNRFSIHDRPAPVFGEEDLECQRRLSLSGRLLLPYVLTRGCRYKCSFCPDYPGTAFEYRATETIVEQLRSLRARYDTDSFYFCESNINNDPKQIRQLSKALIDADLSIEWGGLGTIAGIDAELIDLMARAGCKYIQIGMESGERLVLNRMNANKCWDLDEMKEVLMQLSRSGIGTHLFFIVQYPHESREAFDASLRFLSEMAPYIITSSAFIFQLEETTPIALKPDRFGVKLRPADTSRYGVLTAEIPFDELGGLAWEERGELARQRAEEFRRVIWRQVDKPIAIRLLRKNPAYMLRKYLFAPYRTPETYLAV